MKEEVKEYFVPKNGKEFTARIEEITANGVVKVKFSKKMKDKEDGFDVSQINPKSL